MSRTYTPKASEIERQWLVVDADGQTLGRLATRVARLLTGKHKPTYATHIDTGDHVIVVNAAKVKLTGAKEDQKMYRRHSGYPGGLKETNVRKMRAAHPERIVEKAIAGGSERERSQRKRQVAQVGGAGRTLPQVEDEGQEDGDQDRDGDPRGRRQGQTEDPRVPVGAKCLARVTQKRIAA